jgi:2-iminobutanoate/2-iminopropanoate deaminase
VDSATKKLAGKAIETQTTQVFKSISAILAAAGAGLSSVVRTTVFLKSMDDFAKMNGIYESNKPARSTVQVSKQPLESLVEIECVATLEN